MELKGLKVNFLGDSITESYGPSSQEFAYHSILAKEVGFSEVRNYGISGTRIAEQLPEADSTDANNYCRRYKTMEQEADLIVVFGGTNDYGHGNAPFGSDTDRTSQSYCGALHVLMRGLIEKYPTAEIVFITPLHRQNENVPNMHGKILKDYVDALKIAAEQYSIPVLDLYSVSGICPDIAAQRDALCPDGLHPNDAGHKIIASRLKSFLENL